MILLRRSAEPFHSHSCFDSYIQLHDSVRNLLQVQQEIEKGRDEVSSAMFSIISKISDKSTFHKAKEIRRKAYHRFDMIYDTDLFAEYCKDTPELLDQIYHDVSQREKVTVLNKNISILVEELNCSITNEIKALCAKPIFSERLCIANNQLYSIICKNGFPTRKSHFLTLLKYMYKQETCCTPSSLWSGVALAESSPRMKSVVFGEYNRSRIKYELREQFLSKLESGQADAMVFLNPTLYKYGEFFLMTQFFPEHINTVRFRNNELLKYLYGKYKKQVFSTKTLSAGDTRFTQSVIYELINCDILRLESPYAYGESGLSALPCVLENDGFDHHNIRFENANIPKPVLEDMIQQAKKAFSLYRSLYDSFFEECYFGSDYIRLCDYLSQTGTQNLLEFLYSDFNFSLLQKPRLEGKRRTWSAPQARQRQFMAFCERIKCRYNDDKSKKVVLLKSGDFIDILSSSNCNAKDHVEVVFQFDAESQCVIPEMISMTVGRFLGRYGRFFPEQTELIYKEILDKNSIQVNIEMNGGKDNISYDNPYCTSRIVLYDIDRSSLRKSEHFYTLEDIYIKYDNGEIALCTEDGTKIKINCASTLSPSQSKIYQLFSYLTNLDFLHSPLGGTAKTRLELDLDYQPRIVIDNLLISRERWRINKTELLDMQPMRNDVQSMLKWFSKKGIPAEFYVYTDFDIKPHYCRLGTSFDISNFFSITNNLEQYCYIEEVYPDSVANESITSYNMEVLCDLCLE